MRTVAMLAVLAALLTAVPASADCCRLVKVDDGIPSSQIRACEPDAAAECGELLFAGTLAVGESQEICVGARILVYEEYDAALAAYQPPVEAVCDANDVEL